MNSKKYHLNEVQYHKLCEACDSVLMASDATIERVAIPWLHVVREHPLTLSNYSGIFESPNGIRALIRDRLRGFRNAAGWFKQVGRTLLSGGQFWFASTELPQKFDIVLISHLLNGKQAGQAADFYYGDLPNKLVELGYSVAIVLINHSEQPSEELARLWGADIVPRIILSNSLGYAEEVALHQRLKRESLRLKNTAKNQNNTLIKNVILRASNEALSNGSLTNLRFFRQIETLVTKLAPSAIITIHEGHAWERVVFAAARSVVPDIFCIGYQHAAVFKLQHAIRRNLARQYNPDCILTAGKVGKRQLELSERLGNIPISVLGSNRCFKSYKFELSQAQRGPIPNPLNRHICLVIPEGIVSECNLLFEFSLTCALAYPEIQFIWRLHPVISPEILTSNNIKLQNLPANIVFSSEAIDADIARCSWALYRGSTAVIQAVAAGIRPLYLEVQGEMSIDPLYELDDWRINIKCTQDLKRAIEIDQNHSTVGEILVSRNNAQQYCREFYSPLTARSIEHATSKYLKTGVPLKDIAQNFQHILINNGSAS